MNEASPTVIAGSRMCQPISQANFSRDRNARFPLLASSNSPRGKSGCAKQWQLEHLLNAVVIDIFLECMSSLFKAVNKARRQAQREANRERLGAMIMRYYRIFIRDHKSSGTCEQGAEILEEIQSQLDDTPQSDDVRIRIQLKAERTKAPDPDVTPKPETTQAASSARLSGFCPC